MAALTDSEVQRVRELLNAYYNQGDASVAEELFRIIDRDGSGSLEADELAPIISAISGKEADPEKIKEIIIAADSDGNSTIEPAEFPALLNEEAVRSLLMG